MSNIFPKNSYLALKVDYEEYEKFLKRIRFNYILGGYYEDLATANNDITFLRRGERIKNCCTVWDIEHYRLCGVKDIVKINMCGSKFCFNCQSAKATERFKKFLPVIESYVKERYVPYHFTFTVPNPNGAQLKGVLNKMYKSFMYLLRYLDGRAKIRGLDMVDMFGYAGAVKSLEITNNSPNNYHPHFHCLFLLKSKLVENKTIINKFSYNKQGVLTRKFSEQEVLIQKIWYLLMNGERVTLKNINTLDDGYSCVINAFDDSEYNDHDESSGIYETNSYTEVFKYTLKGNYKDGNFLSAEALELYEDVLYRRRIIQGHGCFYNYDFESVDLEMHKANIEYLKIMAVLKAVENPVKCYETIKQMTLNMKVDKNNLYISRKNIMKIIKLKELDRVGKI